MVEECLQPDLEAQFRNVIQPGAGKGECALTDLSGDISVSLWKGSHGEERINGRRQFNGIYNCLRVLNP